MGVAAFRRTGKRLAVVGVLTVVAYVLTVPFNGHVSEIDLSIESVTAAEAWKFASDLNNVKDIDSNVLDLEIIDDENKMGVWMYTALIHQEKPYIGRLVTEAKYIAKQVGKDYQFTETVEVCKFWMCVNMNNQVVFHDAGNNTYRKVKIAVRMDSKSPLLLEKWVAESMRNDFIRWLFRMKDRLETNASSLS